MNTLRDFLAPPVFPEQEEKTRIATILNLVLRTLMVGLTLIVLLSWWNGDWFSVQIILILLPMLGGVFLLLRTGRVYLSGFLFLLSVLLMITVMLYGHEGIHGTASSVYPAIIVGAALLLPRRGFWAILLLTTVAIFLVILGEMWGWYVAIRYVRTDLVDFLVVAIVLGVTASTARLLADGLLQSLERARLNEQALGAANRRLQQQAADLQHAHAELRQLNADLERRVQERTSELAAANHELESFSYSVSHDLRAPLRSIDGFSHLLEEEYQSRLDPVGQDYLRRVRRSAAQMAALIEDMLLLSRVTRTEMRRVQVDISALAQEILENLRGQDAARQVETCIQPDLLVNGDPALLRAVLQNLLENSWKFTSKTPDARIDIGAQPQDGRLVYFVRDNGAGFDMAFAGKLFGVFERLHPASEFNGTGVGLATVQRIILRHGGRIWAEAAIGQGATFYFTLE